MKIHVKMINFRQSVELIISSKSMHLFMIAVLKCLSFSIISFVSIIWSISLVGVGFNEASNGIAEEGDGCESQQDGDEAHIWSGTDECELDCGNVFGEVLAIEGN